MSAYPPRRGFGVHADPPIVTARVAVVDPSTLTLKRRGSFFSWPGEEDGREGGVAAGCPRGAVRPPRSRNNFFSPSWIPLREPGNDALPVSGRRRSFFLLPK